MARIDKPSFRDVLGQVPYDMQNRIDWKKDYGLMIEKRPSPYQFPAFQHLKVF